MAKALGATVLLFLVGAVALCALIIGFPSLSSQHITLFDQKDLDIVDSPYIQDASAQSLAQKNDDGHTAMWNAAADNEHNKPMRAVKTHQSAYFGVPRFYAHATGWVNDYSTGRAKANGHRPRMSLSLKGVGSRKTSMLLQTKAAATQSLWNAAGNDEIRSDNIGHLHPSEMTELQKLSPEYNEVPQRAHVTSATSMSYHPLEWLQQQQEPSAVQRVLPSHSKFHAKPKALKAKHARFQQLWNAAADDVIGGDPSIDTPGHLEYDPQRWLRNQKDESEMAEIRSRPSSRIFARVTDHEQNFGGAYVNDNSIGVHMLEQVGTM